MVELELFTWGWGKFVISIIIWSFLVKDLLQVLIGDAAIIHRRLVLMLYHQLRGCFSLVLHHNYSRLINLVSKSRTINQIWRAIPFVVILLLVPLSAGLRSLITFISISTLFMIRSSQKKVIWQQNWRSLALILFRNLLEYLLVPKCKLIICFCDHIPSTVNVKCLKQRYHYLIRASIISQGRWYQIFSVLWWHRWAAT